MAIHFSSLDHGVLNVAHMNRLWAREAIMMPENLCKHTHTHVCTCVFVHLGSSFDSFFLFPRPYKLILFYQALPW